MATEKAILDRIKVLIQRAKNLTRGNENFQVYSEEHQHDCVGWMISAWNVAQQVCSSPDNAYLLSIKAIATKNTGLTINQYVGHVAGILRNLLEDMEAGLLASISDSVRAETFSDFLDHAKDFLANQQLELAGVLAGVVFEDTVRRICRKMDILEKDRKLDELITELAKTGVITQTKAKRARAAAGVRTKATHAQWEEFDKDDITSTIAITEEMIGNILDK